MAEEQAGILKALHAVQAEAPTLKKDATGQIQSRLYKYTPLDTIVETLKALLKDNDLVWTSRPTGTHEAPTLIYELIHVPTNERISGEMPIMVGELPTSQALGSAITYARRYALTAVLNLVADEDDDGAAAQGYGRTPQTADVSTGRGKASPAQIKEIKRLKDVKKVTDEQGALIYEKLGIPEGTPLNQLTAGREGQASSLITFLKENPIPTGTSDVPENAGEFEHPEAPDDDEQLPIIG